MATVDCPKCGGKLKVEDDDLRGEWERITYYCKRCDKIFSRLITFKTQSRMTESDEWEGLGPEYVVLTYDDGGNHLIVAIICVEEETTLEEAIVDYLVEQCDWDMEDVIAAKDKIEFFYIDPKVANNLSNIGLLERISADPNVPLNTLTRMEAEIKLAVYEAFRIGGEDKCMQ